MSKLDIARALKDRTYFDSLSEDDKARVRAANPVGGASLNQEELDTVSGGLGGGEHTEETTTSTKMACSCDAAGTTEIANCVCSCDAGADS